MGSQDIKDENVQVIILNINAVYIISTMNHLLLITFYCCDGIKGDLKSSSYYTKLVILNV